MIGKSVRLYVYYYKAVKFYKARGFSRNFKTVKELKDHFNRTSQYPVKFIRVN